MKIKIIKPSKLSGYFINTIIEVSKTEIELIKKYNEIEIIEDESNNTVQPTNKINKPRKG